jgi:hypothetical protein
MINKQTFFAEVRKTLFTGGFSGSRGQKQIEGLDLIIDEFERRGDFNLEELAYILATVFHETAYTMQPIQEYGSEKYLKGKKYWPWIGRGYVQLTWKYNYVNAGKKLGMDLTSDPTVVMKPEIAVKILFEGMREGWFTGKSLTTYLDGVDESDKEDLREFANARRIINGTDKQVKIGKEALKFEKALRKAWVKNDKPLTKSRTIQGAGATGVGGLAMLAEPVQEVVAVIDGKEDALSGGNTFQMIVAAIVIAGALYALYARWDDGGRPKLW